MTCSSVGPLLGRYVDAELSRERRDEVESHLAACDDCRWTSTLLERENEALEGALRGGRLRPAATYGGRRLVVAAAVVLVLLGGSLALLDHAYRGVGAGSSATGPRPVLVQATRMPLAGFVARLSEASGVSITLADGSSADDLIDFELVEPIGLGSVLALLEDFHGLRHRVEGDRIVIHRGKEHP